MPLREGCSPAIVALYREIIGCVTLCGVAAATEARPPLTRPVALLLATSGAIFCGIRLTILGGLLLAGPDITAALVPLTPVFTLCMALAAGSETLRARSGPGLMMLGGMGLCTLSAVLMGLLKGPLLFGDPAGGGDAVAPPRNVPAGSFLMLAECLLAALVQIVNGRTLKVHGYPPVSMTAGVALWACAFLLPAAAILAPGAAAWRLTPSLAAGCMYAGLFGTAANNILLAKANKRLGPTVANLYMPLQQLITAFVDYLTLSDAVYTANAVCGLGVTVGLVFAVVGKQRGDAAAAACSGKAGGGGAGTELTTGGGGALERVGLLSPEGTEELDDEERNDNDDDNNR